MRKENTNIVFFIMLFFFGSILGWLWEMVAFKYTHSGFGWIEIIQNLRGVLHGPWVPIYGFGIILLVLLGQRLKQRPVVLLFSNIVVCAFLEYSTSYILEFLFHARWWDYSTKFLNLHGRIYVGGILFFGAVGMVVVYLIEPWLRSRIMSIHPRIKTVFATLLLIAFLADTFIALKFPNLGIGVSITGGR